MSRAAIIIALARVLNRPVTAEEYDAFRATLLEACPSGRVYVPAEKRNDSEAFHEAANLVAGGSSVRQAAKDCGLKKSRLASWLSKNSAVTVDTQAA